MLTRYSSAAPEEPPEPGNPVTVPVLNPAQIVVPSDGDADPNVGAMVIEPTVHVQIVLHAELEQP
jgi:hypothetical protein